MNLIKKLLLGVIFIITTFQIIRAQNTMYYMDRMPQKQLYNPAMMPNVKFYLALPGINGVSAEVWNSGFNYNELNTFIDNLDNDNYNPDEFINSIGETNRLTSNVRANLMSFGFKLKDKAYFSFNYYLKSLISVDAQSDIAYLLTEFDNLSEDSFPIVVEGIEMKVNTFTTMGFTYARNITDNLTIGVSPRINFNMLGFRTEGLRFEVKLEDSEYGESYEETIDGQANVGLPTEINPDAIDGNELNLSSGLFPDSWAEDIGSKDLFQNASLSLDLGATYKIQKWMLSASVLNIGNSRWKKFGYQLKGDQDVVRVSEQTVKMAIPTQLYLGASRQFSPKWNYAVLLNSSFYAGGNSSSATLSLNGVIGRMLSTSLSYTAGYDFNNLGLGLRLRFLPGADFYFVTDNLIQAFDYKDAKRLTAAVGINLSFGIKQGLASNQVEMDENGLMK